jgi:hypothetical protein
VFNDLVTFNLKSQKSRKGGKAEGGRRKAEGRRQKAEGRKQKAFWVTNVTA